MTDELIQERLVLKQLDNGDFQVVTSNSIRYVNGNTIPNTSLSNLIKEGVKCIIENINNSENKPNILLG